jgi:hypothetical protein
MASSGLFRWEWRADDGIYIEYDEGTNQQIEQAYQCKLRNVEITISTTGLCYSLDLTARRQYPVDNAQDGGEEVPGRLIRRWDSIRNPPPSWDHQVAKFGSFEVEFGTTDYELVSRTLLTRFDGGLHFTPQIVRIQRPQNEPLLGRYNLEKKIMTDTRGAAVAGVVPPLPSLVFFPDLSAVSMHFQRRASGTFFSARKAQSDDGLLTDYANPSAFYGKGCYFAEKARYSHKYAFKTKRTASGPVHYKLMLVNVLCGVSKDYIRKI